MTKRDLAVVPESFFIRKNQLSETHEGMESSEEKCRKEDVVMGRSGTNALEDKQEVSMGKGFFALDW